MVQDVRGDTGVEDLARERLRELADGEKSIVAQLEAHDRQEKARPRVGCEEVLDPARNISQVVAGASREELKQLVRVFMRRVRVGRDKRVEVELYPV